MNALDPSQSPHGANFLPHLPSISAEPQGMDPFQEALSTRGRSVARGQ
jgi:hypothetical protein